MRFRDLLPERVHFELFGEEPFDELELPTFADLNRVGLDVKDFFDRYIFARRIGIRIGFFHTESPERYRTRLIWLFYDDYPEIQPRLLKHPDKVPHTIVRPT